MEFLSLDLPPLLSACFASIACAILGNYLVLRRLSLMGDAISHSVLPGIVIAFLLTSSRGNVVIFIGAALAGVVSAVLIELVRRYGRVETGASMGVIFSIFFALGIILIEQAAARNVDLDADCLLHGQLQAIFWYPPTTLNSFFRIETLWLVPTEVYTSFFTMLCALVFVKVFYKELLISSFDPELSTFLGFHSTLLYQLLMILVAAAVVASFKIVGSILVIAMIICPAATARLYTDKLQVQLYLSVLFAIVASISGYLFGAFGPALVGYPYSLSASGMIAVLCGVLLSSSALFAPKYGVFSRVWRKRKLALQVREDDILAMLYRATEEGGRVAKEEVTRAFHTMKITNQGIVRLLQNGLLQEVGAYLQLSPEGEEQGREVVRRHRLWEAYLVSEGEMSADHVHPTAEKLEHFSGGALEQELMKSTGIPDHDPHGKKIPDNSK